MNGDLLLTVSSLRKEFPMRGSARDVLVAVDDVTFDIERGGSLAIVGESGSGKTTTARIVAGLEVASSGDIRFDGHELRRRRGRLPWPAGHIQLVFQDPFGSLDPRQRVGSCLEEVLALHGQTDRRTRRRRAIELLEEVGLDPRHAAELPRDLSGGQRQRVAIARALAVRPKLLILDEAVASLDVSVQAQVLNLLVDLRGRHGITYLFVSHDLGVVRQVTDTCIVMERGRIVETGSTATVLDAPREPYTKQLLDAVPRPGWTPKRRTVDAPIAGSARDDGLGKTSSTEAVI